MSNIVSAILTAKLSLERFLLSFCEGNGPIELVPYIVQLCIDSMHLSICCYTGYGNKYNYNLIISGNVYGIPYQSTNISSPCNTLYKIANMKNVKKISACGKNMIFLTNNNEIFSKTVNHTRRDFSKKLDLYGVIDITMRSNAMIALTDKNETFEKIISLGDFFRIPDFRDIVKISSGDAYSIDLSKFGKMFSRGLNHNGQLGIGKFDYEYYPPQKIDLENVVDVSCGYDHALALTANGDVYAWGTNGYGQLGLGNLALRCSPQKLQLNNIISIKCGKKHSIVLDKNNRAWVFGEYCNDLVKKPAGTPEYFPRLIETKDIIMIDANESTSMFMTKSLDVYACEILIFRFEKNINSK